MIQRAGAVAIRMLADVKQVTIGPLIKETITPGAVVYTDEYDIDARLPEWGYTLRTVCYAAGEFAGRGRRRVLRRPREHNGRVLVAAAELAPSPPGDLAREATVVPGLLRVRA
jgi:hypothetical protein